MKNTDSDSQSTASCIQKANVSENK